MKKSNRTATILFLFIISLFATAMLMSSCASVTIYDGGGNVAGRCVVHKFLVGRVECIGNVGSHK